MNQKQMRSHDRRIFEKSSYYVIAAPSNFSQVNKVPCWIWWASPIAFITYRIYVMYSSFNFVKSIFLENPSVTWPHFFYFGFIFYCESENLIEISISKLFRIHWNQVWNQPIVTLSLRHRKFWSSVKRS